VFLHVFFAVLNDISANFLPVVVVVRECIVDLREGKGRKFCNKLLWGKAMLENIQGNGPHGKACAMNDGAAPTNSGVARNMRVDNFRHDRFLLVRP
jgi:hypothetical protein